MKLFCIGDHGLRPGGSRVHEFTEGEVERILYTLQAMYASAVCTPDDGELELRGTSALTMQHPCLEEVLGWSEEPEMYLEWVNETVEARQVT